MKFDIRKFRENPEKQIPFPAKYDAGVIEFGERDPENWSQAPEAPELKSFISAAYKQNYEWSGAYARIREAEALAEKAQAARWPFLEADASASNAKRKIQLPNQETIFTHETYELAAADGRRCT